MPQQPASPPKNSPVVKKEEEVKVPQAFIANTTTFAAPTTQSAFKPSFQTNAFKPQSDTISTAEQSQVFKPTGMAAAQSVPDKLI